ncbi:stage III sporulation protein AD [Tenuibacillus multivorans]|uniref:Stage III sporulation protein AD n=1 Tax=Tenuibacillus multivorans TaxID=237069 RepID=A0A1G9Z7R5_9BACI|nr:stage III sporulation protein AD [Tenuibacillus multivorans]GEL77363.1 stage III sporulation protein AD [Tenuibacillus multivorans]SDN17380.1 stage III sporulation protein AD [Tenuibacillus multivorans]
MQMLQILMVVIVGALLIILVREKHETIGFLLIVITGVIVFIFILDKVAQLFDVVQQIVSRFNVSLLHLDTIFKVIGIAYITEFTSQLLKDADLEAIAIKVELVGKIFILLFALPIFIAVLETLMNFIPN